MTDGPPGSLPVTITAPRRAALWPYLYGGNRVHRAWRLRCVASADVTTGAPAAVAAAAPPQGVSFGTTVPVGFGSNVITVAATRRAASAPATARSPSATRAAAAPCWTLAPTRSATITGRVLTSTPPPPTSQAGAFDLTRFQVSATAPTLLAGHAGQPGPHVRSDRRGPVAGRVRACTEHVARLHRGCLCLPKLHDRHRWGLEPAAGGSGIRGAGVG